jgi:hypothetical protein
MRSLSDPVLLRQLFRYLAYQWLLGKQPEGRAEEATTKRELLPIHEVSQLDFQITIQVLLQIALKTGTLFDWVEPAPDKAFEQAFNRTLLPTVNTVEQTLRHRLKAAEGPLQRQIQLEALLKEVDAALAPYQLTLEQPLPELQQLKEQKARLIQLKAAQEAELEGLSLDSTDRITPLDNLLLEAQHTKLALTQATVSQFLAETESEQALERLLTQREKAAPRADEVRQDQQG